MIGVRWTVGDVSRRGFEALRLSIWGAWQMFGAQAGYTVCYNSIGEDYARARTGGLPDGVAWVRADEHIPAFLRPFLEPGLAEGAAWKLAPLRVFPDRFELALDNDCILWAAPEDLRRWLADPNGCLLAEDVIPALGQFAAAVKGEGRETPARNAGIRGLPPGFDLEAAMSRVLREHSVRLVSEQDEQGLQVAALAPHGGHAVTLDDVAICSPFPPHAERMGWCGAHFVGLNVDRVRPYCGEAEMARIAAFWDDRRVAVAQLVGAP